MSSDGGLQTYFPIDMPHSTREQLSPHEGSPLGPTMLQAIEV